MADIQVLGTVVLTEDSGYVLLDDWQVGWYIPSRSAVWVYNPVTGQVCVTVNAPGTYCYTVGPIGGGGVYLRRR